MFSPQNVVEVVTGGRRHGDPNAAAFTAPTLVSGDSRTLPGAANVVVSANDDPPH
jgi:hypothetical protein